MLHMLQQATHSANLNCMVDSLKISHWAPAFSDKCFMGNIHIEHVQRMVYSLSFQHFHCKTPDVFSSTHQTSMSVVLSFLENLTKTTERGDAVS